MLQDRYVKETVLGTGGWGEVYLAVDKESGKKVALKQIDLNVHPNRDDLAQEVKALASLNHPAVVAFVDSFEEDNFYNVVTEFIDGTDLERLLAERRLSLPEIGDIAMQMFDVLSYIHDQGVIHSDLKPGNFLLDREGRIKVIDFGIMRTASAEIAADIKELRGTLHYMSPEQADGRPYDIRSDLFSLGVILYQMCTGRKPFEGDYDMAVMYAIMYEEPVPPNGVNENVSERLSEAILKLLAKEPSERPASSEEAKRLFEGVFEEAAPAEEARMRRIALLKLDNPSGDKESDLIADGLKDEIYARLREVKGIELIPPIKVAQHQEALTSGEEIRSLLGADHYFSGSIRRAGDRIRIYARLYQSSDDAVVWSDKYDNPMSDLFDVIDLITDKVIEGLKGELTGEEKQKTRVRPRPPSPEAMELYLLGRSYYVKNDERNLEYARNLYEQALKIDPDYSLALAGLADYHGTRYMNYFDRGEETVDKCIEFANRALEISPNLPESYRALGRIMHLTGKFREAGEYYLKAVTYKEDYFQAYRALGWLARETLQYDEALQWVRKALSINSADLETIFLKGVIHFERKESKMAINDFTRCMELRQDYGRAGCFLGMTYFQLGNVAKAIEHLRQSIDLGGDINAPYLIGYYQFINGEFDRAMESLKRATNNPEIAFIAHFYLGLINILAGNEKGGLESIRSSADLCRELIESQPEFYIAKAIQAINLAYLGSRKDAESLIEEIEIPAAADGSLAHEIARAYAVLKRPEKAAEYSHNAVATLQGPTSMEIALDPLLKDIVID